MEQVKTFKKGDRVRHRKDWLGTVLADQRGQEIVLVRTDELVIGLGTLGGLCETGHGYRAYDAYLTLIDSGPVEGDDDSDCI